MWLMRLTMSTVGEENSLFKHLSSPKIINPPHGMLYTKPTSESDSNTYTSEPQYTNLYMRWVPSLIAPSFHE